LLSKLISMYNSAASKTSDNNGSRYYYTCLTNKQKTIYAAMLSGIRTYSKEIKMPFIPIDELSMVFNYMLLDNPMIFYVSSFTQLSDSDKKDCEVKPDYKYTKSAADGYTDAINKCLRVFDGLKGKSDIEKELFVHDFCLNNFIYDHSFRDNSYSVLGPVLNRTAVCEGIAKFVKLAFDYLGVESLVVSGKAKNPVQGSVTEAHAWNIVKIGGKAYHLDVTFDMTLKNKTNRYDYFNLSDQDIKKDHIINGSVPVCNTTKGDYYSREQLTVNGFTDLGEFIGRKLRTGNKNSIIMRLTGVPDKKDTADKVMQIALQQYVNIYNKSVAVEIGYNSSQMVFEIKFK